MKNIKLAIALSLIIGLGTNKVIAQIDPHFSQYYANPLWLNPALTGVIDGEYRANINAKQQWANVDNGYLTAGASFDTAPTNKFAFGGMIINQRAGAVSFNQLNALASAAYRIKLGKNGDQILNFGVQAGIISKSLNTSKITLGSQYDPLTGNNGGMPFDEAIAAENFLAPDINAGIMYFDAGGQKSVNLFAGAAVAHINRPADKFIGGDSRLPMRFTGHGGARVKVNHLIDITPNVLYLKQGNAEEVALGAYAQLMLNVESDLIFGSNYRVNDAAIAFLGLHVKSMVFGLSYDFNTSGLNKSTGSRGGLELSISFTGKKGIIGPNFFCPRL
jgi:type IX secretion system PorP/SprF family membrane protein